MSRNSLLVTFICNISWIISNQSNHDNMWVFISPLSLFVSLSPSLFLSLLLSLSLSLSLSLCVYVLQCVFYTKSYSAFAGNSRLYHFGGFILNENWSSCCPVYVTKYKHPNLGIYFSSRNCKQKKIKISKFANYVSHSEMNLWK